LEQPKEREREESTARMVAEESLSREGGSSALLRLSATCRHVHPVEPKVISDADSFLSYREANLVALNEAT
jgi:hypothetical protein